MEASGLGVLSTEPSQIRHPLKGTSIAEKADRLAFCENVYILYFLNIQFLHTGGESILKLYIITSNLGLEIQVFGAGLSTT